MHKFQPGDRAIIVQARASTWRNATGTVVGYNEENDSIVDIRMDVDGWIHGFYEYRLELVDTDTCIAVSEDKLIEILNSI